MLSYSDRGSSPKREEEVELHASPTNKVDGKAIDEMQRSRLEMFANHKRMHW